MPRLIVIIFTAITLLGFAGTLTVNGQQLTKTFQVASGAKVEIINRYGRVEALTIEPDVPADDASSSKTSAGSLVVTAASIAGIGESDFEITSSQQAVRLEVNPKDTKKRVDVTVSMPPGMRLDIATLDGEVRVSGSIESADVRTGTGTIAVDVPTANIRYSLLWTASRPRFLSDFDLEKVKERSAGKFQISGDHVDPDSAAPGDDSAGNDLPVQIASTGPPNGNLTMQKEAVSEGRKVPKNNGRIKLELQTARGIILLNIPPNEVTGDLRERPLTNAAKAIVRSGDSLLMEAVRRAAPKYYSDYTRTLPPIKLEPRLTERPGVERTTGSNLKVASVRVSDANNRVLTGLTAADFEVIEGGEKREVVSVRPSTAPFNLVLLLDVSGSVDNYVTFIRKAARSFVSTVDARDRISVVTFNDDVNVISKFTTDKAALSQSLDSFDAGGATAYYDALAYTLAETLRPLKGERTAVVVLSDGDDNRSFLPFESMLASIQESGALLYPLYVPSGLIAATEAVPNAEIDSLRNRYLQGELTSKAKVEGERLAKVSGGVYYEISKLSQIQTAYEDIVGQLRAAYEVEYRSELGDLGISPQLRIRTNRPNTLVQLRSVSRR